MMLRKETKELYLLYMSPEASMKMKCQVNNKYMYLLYLFLSLSGYQEYSNSSS